MPLVVVVYNDITIAIVVLIIVMPVSVYDDVCVCLHVKWTMNFVRQSNNCLDWTWPWTLLCTCIHDVYDMSARSA